MSSLRSRLTGHFLARVFVLIVALSAVFMVWLGIVAVSLVQTNRQTQATPPTTMLREAVQDTTLTADVPEIAQRTRDRLVKQGQWLQVLDESGAVTAEVNAPGKLPAHYSPGRLVEVRMQPNKMGMVQIFTWNGEVGGHELTYVLGKSRTQPQSSFVSVGAYAAQQSQSSTLLMILGFFAAGAATTLVVAWLSGSALARPLAHMMEWLNALAAGDYAEPLDRDGRPASRDVTGGLRRRFRTYREVFAGLGTLTERLARAEDERERLERAREEWMSGVSHDLRTPLSSVRGYAEVLASDYDFDAAEVRSQASVIRQQADHMDAMLDDLNLTFRLRADALPLARERVDLVELAREAAVELANDPRAHGRHVAFDETAGPVEAEVDAHWFRRALRNLLVNAALHNTAGTTVRVGVARDGAEAVVTVADDGVGMDAETLSRLFDRYYRGTATDRADGTGLGMAIARQLVEAHGGAIDVASAPGEGTTVRVRVPAA